MACVRPVECSAFTSSKKPHFAGRGGKTKRSAFPQKAKLAHKGLSFDSIKRSGSKCEKSRSLVTCSAETAGITAVEEGEELFPKAGWPTMDCPPQPRPDIHAPPTYHGKPDLKSPGERVQVRVYMIDRFGLSRVGRMVLKKPVDAIWHVSVVMYGREYNFADSVAYMELGDTDIATETMHGFAPSHIYEVGNTTYSVEEIDAYVFGVLGKEYYMSNYCSFTHNCHNFADQLTNFATGRTPDTGGFPQWCLNHGGNALSEIPDLDAKQYKTVSNKIARVMLVSFGKFNRERVKKLTGKDWIVLGDEEVAKYSER